MSSNLNGLNNICSRFVIIFVYSLSLNLCLDVLPYLSMLFHCFSVIKFIWVCRHHSLIILFFISWAYFGCQLPSFNDIWKFKLFWWASGFLFFLFRCLLKILDRFPCFWSWLSLLRFAMAFSFRFLSLRLEKWWRFLLVIVIITRKWILLFFILYFIFLIHYLLIITTLMHCLLIFH